MQATTNNARLALVDLHMVTPLLRTVPRIAADVN
jgi:hypothetical protein